MYYLPHTRRRLETGKGKNCKFTQKKPNSEGSLETNLYRQGAHVHVVFFALFVRAYFYCFLKRSPNYEADRLASV